MAGIFPKVDITFFLDLGKYLLYSLDMFFVSGTDKTIVINVQYLP
jgi:hypothetical protein